MSDLDRSDAIFLRDLRVDAVIGIWEWERRIRQTVSIDLWFRCRRGLDSDHSVRLRLRPTGRRMRFRHEESHLPTDGLHPTSAWAVNEVILDRGELVIPYDAEEGRYAVVVNLMGAQGEAEIGNLEIQP